MLELYKAQKGERLRKGFTTGSAAAGAAKAAVRYLFLEEKPGELKIDTPKGVELELEPIYFFSNDNKARAAVVKDGGDDPDVTDGLEIHAEVTRLQQEKVSLEGGKGVGRVTKPGLPVEKGGDAINPVPGQMIESEVEKVLPPGKGVKVTIEIPEGEEVAEDTLNPKLGIEGGLSVLGTTGIVEPMSKEAYKDSLSMELSQAVALGEREIVLVFGNSGKKMAEDLGLNSKEIVRMSNYVGYMLDECSRLQVEEITLLGHIGKIVKVAGGIFNTHSEVADARKEILAAVSAYHGASNTLVRAVLDANTAEEAAGKLVESDADEVLSDLAKRIIERAKDRLDSGIEIKSVVYSRNDGLLSSAGYRVKEGALKSE